MTQEKQSFVIRNKIWIEDAEGNVVFGLGRYRMLDAVKRTGSLQAAAAEMKMSYKALWLRIRASEERMGKSLVSLLLPNEPTTKTHHRKSSGARPQF